MKETIRLMILIGSIAVAMVLAGCVEQKNSDTKMSCISKTKIIEDNVTCYINVCDTGSISCLKDVK